MIKTIIAKLMYHEMRDQGYITFHMLNLLKGRLEMVSNGCMMVTNSCDR